MQEDGEHVRVEIGMTIAEAGQRHSEADDGVSVKGANHLAADVLRNHEDAARDDIPVAVAPGLQLQHNTALEVFEGGKRRDADIAMWACTHSSDDLFVRRRILRAAP